MEGHLLLHRIGDVFQVLLVLLREDRFPDACPQGGQHLFLDPSYGHDRSPQGDLTGHSELRVDRNAGQEGSHGGQNRDPCRRAVLWNGPGRHVDVNVDVLEYLLVDAEFRCVGPNESEGGLRGFLHHVAELAGQGEVVLPLHLGRFHEDDVPSHRRPGQSDGHSGLCRPFRYLREELDGPEIFMKVAFRDGRRIGSALHHLLGHSPANGGHLPFHVSNTRLPCVGADDFLQCIFPDLDL